MLMQVMSDDHSHQIISRCIELAAVPRQGESVWVLTRAGDESFEMKLWIHEVEWHESPTSEPIVLLCGANPAP